MIKTGLCRLETTSPIEPLQVRLIIYMQPFYSSFSGNADGLFDQLLPDALPLVVRMNGRIQNKSVDAAIPGQIDKTYQ